MTFPDARAPYTPFLGLPVEGAAEYGTRQRPVEELRPLFEAVLHDPTVIEFGWQQYTPYDPGPFGVRYIWVRTVEEPPAATARDLWLMDGCPSLGDTYGPNREHYRGPDRDRFERVMALHHALEEGGFDDVRRRAAAGVRRPDRRDSAPRRHPRYPLRPRLTHLAETAYPPAPYPGHPRARVRGRARAPPRGPLRLARLTARRPTVHPVNQPRPDGSTRRDDRRDPPPHRHRPHQHRRQHPRPRRQGDSGSQEARTRGRRPHRRPRRRAWCCLPS